MKKIKMFNFLKKRKTRRKVQKDAGRSMVEMLGVLAIIGVSTIGGIAGYTMAMNRYKANQVLDMASKLSLAAQTGTSGASVISNSKSWSIGLREIASGWDDGSVSHVKDDLAAVGVNAYETTTLHVSQNGQVEAPFYNGGPVAKAIQSITGRDDYVLIEGDD